MVLVLAGVAVAFIALGRRDTRSRWICGGALVGAWVAGLPLTYLSLLGREGFEEPVDALFGTLVAGAIAGPWYGVAQALVWTCAVALGAWLAARAWTRRRPLATS